MTRSKPLCQSSTPGKRPHNISAKRLELEALLARHDDRTWTVRQMREAVKGGTLIVNYVESLRNVGLVRFIGTNEAGHRMWVWHTSSIRPERETAPTVALPRMHVNAAMPNGDAAYWRAALRWGR